MSGAAPPEPLAGWPVRLAVPVAWGEMDALGHVNNVVYLRWFESARMAYFARIGYADSAASDGHGPILHSTTARFRSPIEWPDEVIVATRISEVGEDRFTMEYRVWSRAQDRLAAEGSGIVVSYDYRRRTKIALPGPIRAAIAALESSAGGA